MKSASNAATDLPPRRYSGGFFVDIGRGICYNRQKPFFQYKQGAAPQARFAMNYALIIPTLNAGADIGRLLSAVAEQTLPPSELLIVDSSSEDDTVAIASRVPGVRCITIPRAEFDHGGTRDMALRMTQAEAVVFMTQDALPVGRNALERLLAPLSDTHVAAVGGRQIGWPDARRSEKAVRAHNYPARSRTWDSGDIPELGIRSFLISDVFAAYRREAYLAVGGFDHPLLTNEDMLMAERLLHAGYTLAYAGDAAVYHSHSLTWLQEYRRNYAIGRVLKRYESRFEHVRETGDGIALVKAVLRSLAGEGHYIECIRFAFSCSARLLGNRMGKRDEARRAIPRT